MSPQLTADFRVEPADFHADVKDLRGVRETVFVQEQSVPLNLEWDELDPACFHVLARDAQHHPIGTGRLTPEGKIGRMAVLTDWRGRGVGEALLRGLIEQARVQGLSEVTLHAQVSAIGFYEKFGFQTFDALFDEAGIQHRKMRKALPGQPRNATPAPAAVRGPSVKAADFSQLDAVVEATRLVIASARRELVVYTRELEPALYGRPAIVDAFKKFAISGQGGIVRVLVQDPTLAQRQPHPFLALAQRLPTAFRFRCPQDPEELQYPSVYLANDRDGYLFRLLGSRFEGDWSPTSPARNRQLNELFHHAWERARPCPEFRALGS